MTFLQTGMLLALPLAALPIIIHLIHQHRHRTVKWAAMMFLHRARRMNHGMARLRQIFVLAMRVLALLGLILGASRPLAGGWFGSIAGSGADTVLVVLDRSASMEMRDPRSGESKRETALRKVVDTLKTTGSGGRIVLLDSATMRPLEVDRPSDLLNVPQSGATATGADMPSLFQAALDYVVENDSGRMDVWVCSDLQFQDWKPESSQWEALRTAASEMPGLRFFLLTYPESEAENLSVAVKRVDRSGTRVFLDLALQSNREQPEGTRVTLSMILNGVRTLREVEMEGVESLIQGLEVEVPSDIDRGWGIVELPADGNPMDNVAHFAFSDPPARHTVIVSSNDDFVRPVEVAALAGPNPSAEYKVTKIRPPSELAALPWAEASLIVWQAPLPEEGSLESRQMEQALRSGKRFLFFPPDGLGGNPFLGVSWGDWLEFPDGGDVGRIGWWRTDSDVLAQTRSGKALPVGDLEVRRLRPPAVDGGAILARMSDDVPLLTRVTEGMGAAYFLGALPQVGQSTMARDGVVFYVLLHRALQQGASAIAPARVVEAGLDALPGEGWNPVDAENVALEEERAFQPGVFEREGLLRALQRPAAEDGIMTLPEDTLRGLMGDLTYQVVKDEAGKQDSLISEIWRTFLVLMALALLVESFLTLPPASAKARQAQAY